MNEKIDKVFAKEAPATDFRFNEEVADVFDDMVSRSVPFYGEMQRMVGELARDFARDETNVYDIGCSTGTTIRLLDGVIGHPNVTLIGIDNSAEMLAKAREKLDQSNLAHAYDVKLADVQEGVPIRNASVVTMLLTLQFIRPLYRHKLVRGIWEGMTEDGCLLLIEKLTSADTLFNRLFINYYYDFKRRNGYSSTEIAMKREALENVLIPYRLEENTDLLKESGFRHVEMFFRWYNFCGIVAVK